MDSDDPELDELLRDPWEDGGTGVHAAQFR